MGRCSPRARGRPDQPSPAAVLLASVAEAQTSLTLHLTELGAEGSAKTDVRQEQRGQVVGEDRSTDRPLVFCLSACRACGRSPGAAFRKAPTVADAARVLYGSIGAFEEQVWVLDPLQVY